jgi:hypothetical protein
MGNSFNRDFYNFIPVLTKLEVDYILVVGFSVILHGYSRTTGDLDVWVKKTEMNYHKLSRAFQKFGMPVFDMTRDNFLNHPTWNVFTFGRSLVAIAVMISVQDLDFEEIFGHTKFFKEDDLLICTINKNDRIQPIKHQVDSNTKRVWEI